MAQIRRCLSCELPGCDGLDCIYAEEEAIARAEAEIVAAGAVLVTVGDRVVTIAELAAEIQAHHAACGSGVDELDDAKLEMAILIEAEQLEESAAGALLLYTGCGRRTYAECERAAAEAYGEAISAFCL
jgi:hypothetical protein